MTTAGRHLALLVAAALTSVGAAPAQASFPEVLFACSDARWSVELLGTADGRLLLTTSEPGRPGAIAAAAMSWDEVRERQASNRRGAYQRHLRLSEGGRQIILFEGAGGALVGRASPKFAGVLTITEPNPAQDFRVDCPADDTNRSLLANVAAWAARTGASLPTPEEPGGPFDRAF